MTSKSKQKGDRFEYEMVKLLNDNGIKAKKVWLSDQANNNIRGDIQYGDNLERTLEIKHRENISELLWTWIDGVDQLVVKKNHHEPLVIMRVAEFIELFKTSRINNNRNKLGE